jgi:hypothetical protein
MLLWPSLLFSCHSPLYFGEKLKPAINQDGEAPAQGDALPSFHDGSQAFEWAPPPVDGYDIGIGGTSSVQPLYNENDLFQWQPPPAHKK